MSEVLSASLQLDINQFTASLQVAAQQVAAFASSISGGIAGSAAAFQQQVQAINQVAEATKRAADTERAKAREQAAEQKRVEQELHAQYVARAGFEKKAAQDAIAVEKQMADELTAQHKATSDFLKKQHQQRQADHDAALKAMSALERKEAAERQATARAEADAQKRAAQERIRAEQQAARDLTSQYQATASFQQRMATERVASEKAAAQAAAAAEKERLTQLQANLTFVDRAIANVGVRFQTLAGYAVAGALLALPFKIMEWGKQAVQTAVQMESLTASFNAISGGAAAGARQLAFIRETAQRVGVDFLATAGSFKGLEAAARGTNIEGEKTRRLFENITIGARVMGLSSAETSRTLLALEQMISKGAVSMEELRRQLGNAFPGAVQIMARALGVSTEELMKMVKAGELGVDAVVAFGEQVRREFGGGLQAATETAAATFARFGNNVRDVSVSVGEAILTILKPVVDTINKGFELYERARQQAEEARNRGLGPEPERPASILQFAPQLQRQIERARQLLDDEREVLREMNIASTKGDLDPKTLTEQQALIDKLTDAYKKLLKQRADFLQAQEDTGTIGGFGGETPFARQTKAITEEMKAFDVQLNRLQLQKRFIPKMFAEDGELEMAKEKLREVERAIEKVTEKMGESEGIMKGGLPKGIQTQMDTLLSQYDVAAQEVKRLEDARDLEKQLDQEAKQRREKVKSDQRQLNDERERLEEKMHLAITKQEEGTYEAKLEQMRNVLADAQRTGVNRVLQEEYVAAETTRIYAEMYKEFVKFEEGKFASIKQRVKEQEDLERLAADMGVKATRTKLDDLDAEIARDRERIRAAVDRGDIGMEVENQFEGNAARRRQRVMLEEQEKLVKEQAKPWRELASTIEGTLTSAFQSVLTGSKNLFEGIRDAFLSLLAKLAADALANAIIIPALINLVGGGGATVGGGGTLGSFAALVGGANGEGGSGGAGDVLGTALGMAAAGNTISSAFGGPTTTSVFAGGLSGLAGTELGELGLSGAGYIGGEAGSLGGLAATSIGTVAAGIGAGVATGMVLKQINTMIGIKGTGGSVLAGAGGGALAGTIILPGIGTAIGTAVGALGGYLASIFGGKGKQPGFEFERVQAGQIGYDSTMGLRITEPFKVLDDFHQKLGTDYEEFIEGIDDSFNELFQQVVDQVSNASPDVQKALVDPLNQAFREVAQQIENYPRIGGEDFQKQFERMMGEDIPKLFTDGAGAAIGKFLEAVKKIDPVVKAFEQIIDKLADDIQELERQRLELNASLEGNLKTLREGLMTPAELLATRKQEFAGLLSQFDSGDEATRIALAPQIGQLSTVILDLSKQVFNLQNQQAMDTSIFSAVKSLEESLYTPQQTLAARQTDFANLVEQFRKGDQGIRAVLTPQIAQLALQIMDLAKGVNQLAEQQALLADFPAQMRAITEALFSPAQSYLSMRDQLTVLVNQFRGGTAEQQIALEPQIAQLAAEIINLAKGQDVMGQDPQLLRQTQQEMIAVLQEVQGTIANQAAQGSNAQAALQATLERTQAELMGVLREVQNNQIAAIVNQGANTVSALWGTAGQIINTEYVMGNGMINATYTTGNGVVTAQYNTAGQLVGTEHYIGGVLVGAINNTTNTNAAWSSYLYNIQASLIGAVQGVQASANQSFYNLQQALWYEIGIAQYEIQLLTASLNNLSSVDAAVQRALGVLGEMNWRLGNPLQVNPDQSLSTQLQRDQIYWLNQLFALQGRTNAVLVGQLAVLAGVGYTQAFQYGHDVTGFQHGGYVPRNMRAFLHAGEQVIPEWQARHGEKGGRSAININVYGGGQDASHIADLVINKIEQKSGRFQSSKIQVTRR